MMIHLFYFTHKKTTKRVFSVYKLRVKNKKLSFFFLVNFNETELVFLFFCTHFSLVQKNNPMKDKIIKTFKIYLRYLSFSLHFIGYRVNISFLKCEEDHVVIKWRKKDFRSRISWLVCNKDWMTSMQKKILNQR